MVIDGVIETAEGMIPTIPDDEEHQDLIKGLRNLVTSLKTVSQGKVLCIRDALSYLELMPYDADKTIGQYLYSKKIMLVGDEGLQRYVQTKPEQFPIPAILDNTTRDKLIQLHQELYFSYSMHYYPQINEPVDYLDRLFESPEINKSELSVVLSRIQRLLIDVRKGHIDKMLYALLYLEKLLSPPGHFETRFLDDRFTHKRIAQAIHDDPNMFFVPSELSADEKNLLQHVYTGLQPIFKKQYESDPERLYHFTPDAVTGEITTTTIQNWKEHYLREPIPLDADIAARTLTDLERGGIRFEGRKLPLADINKEEALSTTAKTTKKQDIVNEAINALVSNLRGYPEEHQAILKSWLRSYANQDMDRFVSLMLEQGDLFQISSIIQPAEPPIKVKVGDKIILTPPQQSLSTPVSKLILGIAADSQSSWEVNTNKVAFNIDLVIKTLQDPNGPGGPTDNIYLNDPYFRYLCKLDSADIALVKPGDPDLRINSKSSWLTPLARVQATVSLHVERNAATEEWMVNPQVTRLTAESFAKGLRLNPTLKSAPDDSLTDGLTGEPPPSPRHSPRAGR